MLEGLITIILVGGLMAVGIAAVYATSQIIIWQGGRTFRRIKREREAMIQVFSMVSDLVGGHLNKIEFDQAVEYATRKYNLGDNGVIEYYGSDLEYLAELIAETVGQQRIFESTLLIAQCDLEDKNNHYKEESIA